MDKKITAVFVAAIFLFFLFIAHFSFAAITPTNPSGGLLQPGQIRTCLAATFVGTPPHGSYPPIKATKYELKGTCASPTGCSCKWNQSKSNAGAMMDEMGNDCEEYASGGKKRDPDKERNRRVHCNHVKHDASNIILQALQPIVDRNCTIIQNKLGGPTKGLLPYGPVDIIVQEESARHTSSYFMAVGDAPVIQLSTAPTAPDQVEDEQPSQQLEQLGFVRYETQSSTEESDQQCTTISWDPYGRVFDAQSLEPISDAEVVLIDASTGNPVNQSMNWNSDITGEDGVYNIQLEKEGNFKLGVNAGIEHKFSTEPNLNPLWNKIYSDLYRPGSIFYEQLNVPTHLDIALNTPAGPYHDAVAEMIENTLVAQNLGDRIVYMGRETFPFADVCLTDSVSKALIGKCVRANSIGNFSITVAKKDIPPTKLEISAAKVDLTNPELYLNAPNPQTLNINSSLPQGEDKKYYFEPILSHLVGYAYDENGNVIPNAEVVISLNVNSEEHFRTRADENGFFTVKTTNLPYVEYYIQFVNPETGEKTVNSTSEFIEKNKNYLKTQNINLITATKDNSSITEENRGEAIGALDVNPASLTAANETAEPNKLINVILVFFLVILVMISFGIIIYLRRKPVTG